MAKQFRFSPTFYQRKFGNDPSKPGYWAIRGYGVATNRVARNDRQLREAMVRNPNLTLGAIRAEEARIRERGGVAFQRFTDRGRSGVRRLDKRFKKKEGVKITKAVEAGGKDIVIKGGRIKKVTPKKTRQVAEENRFSIVITTPDGKIVQKESGTLVSDVLRKARSRVKKDINKSQTLAQQISDIEQKAGLQAKIVDNKSGKVVQEGRFKLDKTAQRQLQQLRKTQRIQKQITQKQIDQFFTGASGLKKALTKQQQQNFVQSFNKSDIPGFEYLLPSDIKFLTNIKNKTRDNIQKKLIEIRKRAWEQNYNLPFSFKQKDIRDVKKINPFTKNYSDAQALNYVRAALISKPTLTQKVFLNPDWLKTNKLLQPNEVVGGVIDLQRTRGLTKKEKSALRQIARNAPKDIALGIGEALYEVLWKLPKAAVVGSFNYGRSLVKRAQKEKTKAINVFGRDILKLNKGAIGVRKFVTERPKETAIIVGLAIGAGLDALEKDLNKNPVRTLSKSVTYLVGLPETVGGKFLSRAGVTRFLEEAKFVGKQPKAIRSEVRAILKGAKFQEKLSPTQVKKLNKINFSEVQNITAVEARALRKTLKETDSFIFGSLPARTISKGKTPLPKDVDLATKNKSQFLKQFIENLPKDIRKDYIVKGEKVLHKSGRDLFDIKSYARLRPNQSIFGRGSLPIYERISKNGLKYRIKLLLGKVKPTKAQLQQATLTIPVQKLQQIEGIKIVGFGEQTTRKALGTLQVIIEQEAKRAKDPQAFIVSLKIQLEALKGNIPKSFLSRPFKKYTAKQLENAIKVLESKKFANILDDAVPGLTKQYPILKRLKNVKRSNTTKAFKKKLKQIKDKIKQATQKAKKKLGIKPKKKKVTKKKPKPKKKPKKSKIPKAKKSKIPKSRVPKKSKIPKSKIRKPKPSKVPKKKPSKVPRAKVKPSRVPKSKVTPSKVRKAPTKVSRVPKAKPRPSKVPKGPAKKKRIILPKERKRLPSPDFDSDSYKNKILKFEGTFRERRNPKKLFNKKTNPIVTKTIKFRDTRNRVLAKVAKKTDTKAIRSMQLKIVGVTAKIKKDIVRPKILSKFTRKKNKSSPALILVEKPRFALDKGGEKRELARSRKLRKSKTKRTKKKTKAKKKTKSKTKKKK